LTAARDKGCLIAAAPDDRQFSALRQLGKNADVIVDALLGTAQ